MEQNSKKLMVLPFILMMAMSFSQSKDWFLLKSNQFGYEIKFPEKPTKNNQVIDSEIGELTLNIFSYDASQSSIDENLIYMVNCTVYPASLVNSDSTEILSDFYRNSIDGAVSNVKGKLLSEKVVDLGAYQGREVEVDFRDGLAVINMRMFLVGNKMYLMQTITKTDSYSNKSIDRFMNSFKLL